MAKTMDAMAKAGMSNLKYRLTNEGFRGFSISRLELESDSDLDFPFSNRFSQCRFKLIKVGSQKFFCQTTSRAENVVPCVGVQGEWLMLRMSWHRHKIFFAQILQWRIKYYQPLPTIGCLLYLYIIKYRRIEFYYKLGVVQTKVNFIIFLALNKARQPAHITFE